MQLIVNEVLGNGTKVEQEFTTLKPHSIERVRCHVCFIDIDKATNPGSITLELFQDTTLLATKTYTFDELVLLSDFGSALQSTSAQWHGYLSFVWDAPANIREGVYILKMSASYTFSAAVNWIGWIKEHDDMKYDTYSGDAFPVLLQEEVPHSFEIYTYTKIST